jgi:hypothetical protein
VQDHHQQKTASCIVENPGEEDRPGKQEYENLDPESDDKPLLSDPATIREIRKNGELEPGGDKQG